MAEHNGSNGIAGDLRKAAALYIDGSENLARALLGLPEWSASLATDSVITPFFEAQRAVGSRVVDNILSLARGVLGVEKEA